MKRIVISASFGLALASGAALAADAQQLLKEKNCLTCHQLQTKVVGPAYKDVAAKYKARKDAEAYLVTKIKGARPAYGARSRCRLTGRSTTRRRRRSRSSC